MNGSRHHVLAASLVLLICTVPADAQIALRFSPADPHAEVATSGVLSVMLDEAIVVRTLELWISYDETVVANLGGDPGALFTGSGCPLFPFFDHEEDGAWYGGAVTLGPTCYFTGPGELYRWEFEGLVDGTCPVRVDSLALFNELAELYPDVTLANTAILVGDATAAEPPRPGNLDLYLYPNPFNPGTRVSFEGPEGERVAVAVYDVTGRRIATIWDGSLAPGPTSVRWDGTDRHGRAVAGGTYLFRIQGQEGRHVTRKGILLK